MKAFRHKVNPILLSWMISAGIILLCHFLFGPCGYVRVKSSITDMNNIFDAWQTLRNRSMPTLSVDGLVSIENMTNMETWRTLAYTLQVPSCLKSVRSTLIDAIESDYQTFHLAQDRISIDQKLQYLDSNKVIFDRYIKNVELIETCSPLCDLLEVLSIAR